MQRIVMTAAVMLLGAGFAVTTAKAEMNPGPIVDQTKGLCFQKSTNGDVGFFGYWTECPKPAATPTATPAPTVHHRQHKHS
jgi:hypothetical protein